MSGPQLEQQRETRHTTDPAALKRPPSDVRVHVVGAGPVGLLLTALLQSMDGCSVHLYEKRRGYTRTRMVQLAPYLVAGEVVGTLGVLGPTRMDYRKAQAAVATVSQQLGRQLSQ